MLAAEDTEGIVMPDDYELVREAGRGGMGVVYEARHPTRGRVAIKVLSADLSDHAESVERFKREAQAAAALETPHVVEVYDVGITDDLRPFMVMELLEGEDLDDLLHGRQRLDPAEAVRLVLQACEGIAAAHAAGIVHRDLKPQNLFLARRGDATIVKLLDFGISKIQRQGAASVTQTATAMGTPVYMSPEQVRSAKHVDHRTDIWALGVILYELICGAPPFDHDTPTAILAAVVADPPVPLTARRADVSPALAAIVMRCLHKSPAGRFQTVTALAAALRPFTDASMAMASPAETAAALAGHATNDLSAQERDDDSAATWLRTPHGRESNDAAPAVTGATEPSATTGRWLWAAVALILVGGGVIAFVSLRDGSTTTAATPSESVVDDVPLPQRGEEAAHAGVITTASSNVAAASATADVQRPPQPPAIPIRPRVPTEPPPPSQPPPRPADPEPPHTL